MNKFLKLFVLLPLTIITTSCGTSKKMSNDDCISYMNNKYNQSFKIVNDNGMELTNSFLEIYVQDSSKNIAMVVEELKDGTTVFHDNYVAVKFDKQLEDFVQPIATEHLGQCRVLNEVDFTRYQPDDYNDSTTFDEFKRRSDSKIYLQILLPPTYNDEAVDLVLKHLESDFMEYDIVGTCDVYFCNDTNFYNTANNSVDIANNEKHYDQRYQFRTEAVGESVRVVSKRWD